MEEDVFTIDKDSHIVSVSPMCVYCQHQGDGRTCAAFPAEDSIPLAIWQGEYDHRQPYAGDHGISFAPVNAHCATEVATHFVGHPGTP